MPRRLEVVGEALEDSKAELVDGDGALQPDHVPKLEDKPKRQRIDEK